MTSMNKKRTYIFTGFGVIGIIVLVILYFTIFTGGKSGKIKSPEQCNLLVITLDTTRADYIGAYGATTASTPNIDKLAADGILFEHCSTSVPITLPSHCSIFTGQYPLAHQVRDNGTFFLGSQSTTMAEKMKESGKQTYAVIAAYILLAKFGLNQGFDLYDDSLNVDELIKNLDSEIDAAQVYSKFSTWLKGQSSTPFFAWVHFYDPHSPYNPPEPYKSKFGSRPEDLYIAEISYVDEYIGKIVDDLKAAGQLDKTVIIIAGDHGEGFGEHGEFGHALMCYEESLEVPLIFSNPDLLPSHKRIADHVNLIDVMPTVLDMFSITPPPNIQGMSLLPLMNGKKENSPRTFYIESMHGKEEFGWAPLMGIIDEGYKYISLPEPELYDLHTDKIEKNNLFLKMNHKARALDKKLMELVKTYSTSASQSGGRRSLTADDKAHLQSLGYISAFSGKTDMSIDPKKGLIIKNRYESIGKEIDLGNIDGAEKQLHELVAENPTNMMPQYFGMLNTIYKKKNDTGNVLDTWKKAIQTYPDNDNFRINLAFEYFQMNKLEEADHVAVEILNHDPSYTRAVILRQRITEKRGQFDKSKEFIENALSQEPHNVSLRISYARLLGTMKKYKEAADLCSDLLKDPGVSGDISSQSKIGVILAEIHHDGEALNILERVESAGQADAEAYNYLGILHYRKGEMEKALAFYRKSIEKDSKIARTHNNIGTLFLTVSIMKKNPQLREEAIKAFNTAIEIDPGSAAAYNGRGSAYRYANRIQESITDWKKALTLEPSFTDPYFNLAITYIEFKNKPEALKFLRLCKEKYYNLLLPPEKQRLERLILEAGG